MSAPTNAPTNAPANASANAPLHGAREGEDSLFRRLVARALARELSAFVVPGVEVARARGIDLEAAGLRLADTPRHASVLVLVGGLPEALKDAAAVAYAQMPRPRAVLAVGSGDVSPLPGPDVSVPPGQGSLTRGVAELRRSFAGGAFAPEVAEFEVEAVRTRTEYVCPMHPEVVSEEPGSCPRCGMDLVPRESAGGMDRGRDQGQDQGRDHARTEDPGHDHAGHAGMDDHGGRDQARQERSGHGGRDGAGQEATDQDAEGHPGRGEEAATGYRCPMHPEVVGDGPGSCHVCGMDLVPPEDTAATDGAGQGHAHGHGHGEAQHGSHEEHGSRGGADNGDTHHGEGSEGHEHHGDGEQGGHEGHGGMDHGGHGHMDHGDMGFMSMVEMTRDLPRGNDGLPMERVEAPFGPLFPGLPGGLRLSLTLDGDAVAEASAAGAQGRPFEGPPEPAGGFADRLSGLDPLSPVAYRVLALRAAEQAAGISIDEETALARAGALERERAASHLNWLAGFAHLLGHARLEARAARLQLALLRARDATEAARLREEVGRLARGVERTPLLRRKLRGVGPLPTDAAAFGPVARAGGRTTDQRTQEDLYRNLLGFEPVLRNGDDALSRLLVRLEEARRSLDLVRRAGAVSLPPFRPGAYPDGTGSATVETPRGAATLGVWLEEGAVSRFELDTPSSAHLELAKPVAEGEELADALVGVASLDLSPWGAPRGVAR